MKSVRTIRRHLRLTQSQLASLIGVHSLTVSRWERLKLKPSPWHRALLNTFSRCHANEGPLAVMALHNYGPIVGLMSLLRAAGL